MATKIKRRITSINRGLLLMIFCFFAEERIINHFNSLNIQYVKKNKENDNDWFRLESNSDGTKWFGKCWYIYKLIKYEFDIEFDVSVELL